MDINELGLCDWIYPYILKLLRNPTGLCVGGVKIDEPTSSSAPRPGHYNKNQNDIFTIAVPLAGDIIRWQFIFDGTNPDTPPDILLPDFEDFDPEFENIPSLSKWNKENEDSLLLAVKEVVNLYKEHHKQKCLSLGNKFKEEVLELTEHKNQYNTEICLKQSERTGNLRVVSVLVQLPVDFSEIVDKDVPLDVVIYNPLLLIKYEIDAGKVVPSLYMPSHIGPVLAAPQFVPGMSMLDYVLKTEEKLRDSLKIMKDSHAKRREYVVEFLRLFSKHTVEYDADKFMQISFLFSYQTFYFFLHIALSKSFPNEPPVLTFQSAYHFNRRNQPYQNVCANYPYSPRWSGTEMAKRAKAFVLDYVGQFKDSCIRNGVL